MKDAIDWDALCALARSARAQAHAPYSGYAVGAALLARDGRVFTGANVENASYGLCQCAERNAVGAAVSAGVRAFSALVVVTGGPAPASPCGACRQVLAEFPPSFPVRCYGAEGSAPLCTTVAELLPHAFGPSDLGG
jgi:cytidine deaminase